MRFVFAILSFVVAAGMITLGVAQRTVLLQPDEVERSVVTEGESSLTVIDGSTLNSFDGAQTISVRGEGTVFVGYGRAADVHAWVGESEHHQLIVDAESGELIAEHIAGTPAVDPAAPVEGEADPAAPSTDEDVESSFEPIPNPFGSDLWLENYVEERSLQLTVKVPQDAAILIASDGTAPAPSDITLSWPIDNSTPWAGPLMVGGAIVLLIGLGFLFWAILHMRNARGPRRKPHKMPKLPRQPRGGKPSRKAIESKSTGRRALGRGMIAVPIVLIGTLALTGCNPESWPRPMPKPAPSPSASADPNLPEIIPPAATSQQIERIVGRVAEVAAEADETLDATLIETRFDATALQLRAADYAIRALDSAIAFSSPTIPVGPVRLMLPQQTEEWPRTIFTVVQDSTDATIPPVALYLVQQDPRSNYKVHYAVKLEPSVRLPDVASASIGAARLGGDSGVLKTAPGVLALAYADILANDIESDVYLDFEAEGDSLRATIGLAARQALAASLPSTAAMTFTQTPGSGQPIALATNDSGALVAVDLVETTTVAPTEEGAAVGTNGAVKALSGVTLSTTGVVATYSDQLLFYVPPAGSDGKIVLLGWSQGLVAAKEIQ